MVKIAIRFGDNDFHSTWKGVLETFAQAFMYSATDIMKDKEAVVEAINKLSYPCFFLFQHRWDIDPEYDKWQDIREEHYKDYLTVTADRVMINEEVDKYKAETEWNNSETFVLEYDEYNRQHYIYSI